MGRRGHVLLVYLLTSSHREYLEFVLPRYPYLDSESSLYELFPRYSRATLTGFCSIDTRKWPEELDEVSEDLEEPCEATNDPEKPDEVTEDLDTMSVSIDHENDFHICGPHCLSLGSDLPSHTPLEISEEHSDDSDDSDDLDNLDGLDGLDDTQMFHHGCDKHIFIDKDLQSDVACVFVMAEQRNIYHALSSALYHRRAVGIQEPIIGLTFGEHGSRLHLILAWLEKDLIHLDQALVSFSQAAFLPLALSFLTFLAGGSPCACSVRSGWYDLEWCLRHARSDSSTLSCPCTPLSAPEPSMHNLPGDSREQILADGYRYAAGPFLAR